MTPEETKQAEGVKPAGRSLETVYLLALIGFLFLCSFFHVSGVDVGFHYRVGSETMQSGSIMSVNTFSHTHPDHQYLLQQWWPAAVFSLIYDFGGVTGLILFKALLTTGIMLIIWLHARKECGGQWFWPILLVTIAVMVARERFFIRPFLFSALWFVLMAYWDRRFQTNRRWQWIGLPALMAVWANTHGGALYGFGWLGLWAAGEWLETARQRWALRGREKFFAFDWKAQLVRPVGLVISLAAMALSLQLINPHGVRVLLGPLSFLSGDFWQRAIAELQAPGLSEAPVFFASLAGLILLQAACWKRVHFSWLLTSAAFAFLACRSQRSILFYALAVTPHAAWLLASVRAETRLALEKGGRWLLVAAWCLIVTAKILPDPTYRFGVGYYPPYYPRDVYAFMNEEVPEQNLFNHVMHGGGALWWLYPKFKPFIDGRGTAYPVSFWEEEYFPTAAGSDGWKAVFEKYEITAALLPVTTKQKISGLGKLLYADPEWALAAFGDYSLLFLKRTETNRKVIAENEYQRIWPGDWSMAGVTPDAIQEAGAEAERALRRAPSSLFARTAAAKVSMVAGDYGRAETRYAGLVADPNASAVYWRDYGYVLFQLNKLNEAEAALDHIIDQGEELGFAYYMKHFIAIKRGDVPAARELISLAVQLEPENVSFRAAHAALFPQAPDSEK